MIETLPSRHYLRFPHLHGDLVTFVAEDDVWLAPLDGGHGWRLTSMALPAANPRFSPDGTKIAWSTLSGPAPEVFVAGLDDAADADLAQRTWWGNAKTRVRGWLSDTEILAVSSVREPGARATWAYSVPAAEGAPRRLPFGTVDSVAVAPDGAVALGSGISREPAWWKRYRGGTAGKLWVRGAGDDAFQRYLADVEGHLVDVMWVGERIAFLADHEGHGNVYSVAADGSDLRRHTDHEGFYARHAATDGERVIYERAGHLWLLDDLDAEARPLHIALASSRSTRRPRVIDVGANLRDLAVDRTGRASAVEVHGTAHWLTHRDGPIRAIAAEPGVRARLVRPLGEELVVYVDDADGEEAVVISRLDGTVEPRRVVAPYRHRLTSVVAAPDGARVAVSTELGALWLLDTASGAWTEVVNGALGPIEDIAFAPDSGWLAWSEPVAAESARSKIRLAATEHPQPVDVTDGRFLEAAPSFAPDGSFLAFLSHRSFDPVYDTHRFDLGFPASAKPYLVTLAAATPSPFGPSVAGQGDASVPAEPSADAGVPVVVDLDGIAERLVAVPVVQGTYTGLIAIDGALLWAARPLEGVLGDGRASLTDPPGKPVLQRFDLGTRRVTPLAEGISGFWVSGDGKRVVVRDDAGLRVVPSTAKVEADAPEAVTVDVSRLQLRIDPAKAWAQAFAEDWRLLRDFFWLPDMSGVDWEEVRTRYRPLVDAVGSYDDFVDLLWEVHGELATSHAYVYPLPATGADAARQGLLGADLTEVEDGWQVERVLPGESSDPRAVSPLRAPGVDVRVGDVITAVNGLPVAMDGVAPLLAGTAGKAVEVTVRRDGQTRRVALVPLADEEQLRYQDLVATRRARVREGSQGRFGYLHIPDMVANGWAQLHRDLDGETAKDALVVDVRGNRGGHTSQLVAELIGRRVLGWDVARGTVPSTYPAHAARGPVVVLADEWAGSDGDIITQVVKLQGIGPVVGMRTWGGVIGIDGRFDLADGTRVTQPRYSFWFSQGVGWGVEGHGVDPDIEVPIAPHEEAAGEDPQLDRALEVLRDLLVEQPTATPPSVADRPNRSVGPLPPRP